MLVLSLPAFENKKYTAYDRFHRNGPYGEIQTKKEPIRKLGFTLSYNNVAYGMSVIHIDFERVKVIMEPVIPQAIT